MTQVKPVTTAAHHAPTAMELELAQLRAENQALKLKKAFTGSNIKVSTKGAISVYGMGRWPVTLYASQWQQLSELMPSIGEFIITHAELLAEKKPTETKQA